MAVLVPRQCACGRTFQPHHPKQVYCSSTCPAQPPRQRGFTLRTCPCGATFQPRSPSQHYCRPTCPSRETTLRTCPCGATFRPRKAKQKFCSNACPSLAEHNRHSAPVAVRLAGTPGSRRRMQPRPAGGCVHYWLLDHASFGVCQKCGARRQFGDGLTRFA